MSAPVVEATNLTKAFDDRVAVDGVSFHIEPGETYGLLGPNGAGKTTTISMLCGLREPDAGTVSVGGHDMATDPIAAKRAIGYVPQDLALYPDLTGRENLVFFGRLQGLRGDDLRARVDHTLDVVQLRDRADERVDAYSGGMKRRVNIAAGLLHDPAVLVLDEPTVGVDPQSRNAILESVAELGGAGLAILYTTHYMEEAERLCHRIGIIDGGRLIAEGTRDELSALVGEQSRIRIETSAPVDVAAIAAIGGVTSATQDANGVVALVDRVGDTLAPIVAAAGRGVSRVEIDEPDLEAVFLHLTGKALRDQ